MLTDCTISEGPSPFSSLPGDEFICTDARDRFSLLVDFQRKDLYRPTPTEKRLLEILQLDNLYRIKHLCFDHCRGVGECLVRILSTAESRRRPLCLGSSSISLQRALKVSDMSPELLSWLTRFSSVNLSYNGRVLSQFVPYLVTSAFEHEKCFLSSLTIDDCPLDYASLEIFSQWLEVPGNNLASFSLRNTGLGVVSVHGCSLLEYVVRSLADYGRLVSLDISQNSNVDSYLLVETLTAYRLRSLTELRLEYVNFADDMLKLLANYISTSASEIEVLSLASCRLSISGLSEFCGAFGKCRGKKYIV
jgi:hypothetical protein